MNSSCNPKKVRPKVMIWKVTLNGTLADFDEAARAAAKAALVVTFNQPSITAKHITLTVEAGSYIVTGEVRVEDPLVDFTALSTLVTDLFYNETAMIATFGLPLISVVTQPKLKEGRLVDGLNLNYVQFSIIVAEFIQMVRALRYG